MSTICQSAAEMHAAEQRSAATLGQLFAMMRAVATEERLMLVALESASVRHSDIRDEHETVYLLLNDAKNLLHRAAEVLRDEQAAALGIHFNQTKEN